MGFFSRLFGGGKSTAEVKNIEPIEYKGFLIYQDSISENGQYRIAGRIEKEFDGEVKSHRFIRSDLLGSEQDANELMLKKSQMFIDQMGEKIFD
ncbi:HlyU family transcriptional regulator [Vibrio alfacsensis]|uniref:HlyU family transcriptional regulator n=1 Tax=Vibrio alfacsensis TaxID=1074311 RepID=UPI001BEF0D13|nr:HlyU family transcriptional regulator [Vibrio alfacsensis]WQE78288.1 HlyU family transcriptional regulator [Vibrio alfacsensis]BBM66725.1 transcriptional activator HlyU [Vibrio alfacsensis]BCN26123.1 transcriptional activator HlyU [Vibrio alfacsensis]